MTDFKQQVATVAASLRVREKTEVGPWSHWTLVHNPESQASYTCSTTWVVQGPCSLIVTGDMGTMVFERPSGGLGLGFARSNLSYAAQKCAAGEPWDYDGATARNELMAELQERADEEAAGGDTASAEHWRAKMREADEAFVIDWFCGDASSVTDWYSENVRCDEIPDFGRVPSPDLLRALACLEAVLGYEKL